MLTLRAKNAADHDKQLAYHRAAALAHALLSDTRAPVLTAAQPAPYRTPATPAGGTADIAQRVADLEIVLEQMEREQAYAQRAQLWDLEARAQDRMKALRNRITRLRAMLREADTAPRTPRGCPWTYLVTVPAVRFAGYEAEYPKAHLTLDVRTVPDELWQPVRAWLHTGSIMKPIRYVARSQRYKEQSQVNGEIRAILWRLLPYLSDAP